MPPFRLRAAIGAVFLTLVGIALGTGLLPLLDALTPALAQPAATASRPPTAADLLAVGPHDKVLGKADAKILVIEYAALTCPHCANFDVVTMPKVRADWIDAGKAKIVVRPFPLDRLSLLAAQDAEAFDGDRYYAFIDALWREQRQWVLAKDPVKALDDIALLAGLGRGGLQKAQADTLTSQRIIQGEFNAQHVLGAVATPTFFINGTKLQGDVSYARFNAALEAAQAQLKR